MSTFPEGQCAELHDRMRVILNPQSWPAGLGERSAEMPELKALLAPYRGDDVLAGEPPVGNVKNNDPSLIERIAATG